MLSWNQSFHMTENGEQHTKSESLYEAKKTEMYSTDLHIYSEMFIPWLRIDTHSQISCGCVSLMQ